VSRVRVKNAADEAQVAEADRVTREETKRLASDVRRVLATPEGRRVFGWLLATLNPDRAPVGSDTHGTYRNIGLQDAGRLVRDAVVAADVETYLTLHKEIVNG
jgi:hypothetical protein